MPWLIFSKLRRTLCPHPTRPSSPPAPVSSPPATDQHLSSQHSQPQLPRTPRPNQTRPASPTALVSSSPATDQLLSVQRSQPRSSPYRIGPYAETLRGAWILDVLRISRIPFPKFHATALRETYRAAASNERLAQLFAASILDTGHIDRDTAAKLVHLFLARQWPDLRAALLADEPRDIGQVRRGDRFSEFREMTLEIFYASRKMERLPSERRQMLGITIASATNQEQLMSLMLSSLGKAQTLDDNARSNIANDVLDGLYYNLVLPDRFDCVENQQLSPEVGGVDEVGGVHLVEEEKCAICLGDVGSDDFRLPCASRHGFHGECIILWAVKKGNPFDCPLCRTSCQRTRSADGIAIWTRVDNL